MERSVKKVQQDLRIMPTTWEITLVGSYASPASDFANGGFM